MKSKSLALAALVTMSAAISNGSAAIFPTNEGETILALGDSIAFGAITRPGFQSVNADNFIAYADYLGLLLHAKAVNAACPGESTSSFLSSTAVDNGCQAYRAAAPLHVSYATTQLEFATSYLTEHQNVRLVTLQLGANDGLELINSCASAVDPLQCVQNGLPALLQRVATNIGAILAALRSTGYGGPIVLVNYYSTDYSDPILTSFTALLNQAISAPAAAFGAIVSNAFGAFALATAAPAIGGKTCHAGLLNVNPLDTTTCDVHPAQSGHQLLAKTVARTLRATQE